MIRRLKNLYHLLSAFLAVVFYRFPGWRTFVIGVTGTDGKTTTVHLIAHLLRAAGKKVAMISTVSAPGFHVTTPNSWQLQRFLRQAVSQGKEYVVLEATSHGLDQYRLFGCHFRVGVVTNISHEHLDYHRTWEAYLQAKARLFEKVEWAILNKDDRSYQPLVGVARKGGAKVMTYAIKKAADLKPETFPFKPPLKGEFNLYNCLSAVAAVKALGVGESKIPQGLGSFKPVKGRLEEIGAGQDFRILVDFAHTPNAFKQVLPAARQMTKGKLIHVFGCTGDRDRSKRPLMGEIAAQFSDKIILTHEDTYTEEPRQIIAEIESGVKKTGRALGKDYWKVGQRRAAIEKAIELAKKGDTILITGVGHQESLNIGGREVPWSDQKAVREILKTKK